LTNTVTVGYLLTGEMVSLMN